MKIILRIYEKCPVAIDRIPAPYSTYLIINAFLTFLRAAGEQDGPHGGRVREAGPVLQRLLGIQGETGEFYTR